MFILNRYIKDILHTAPNSDEPATNAESSDAFFHKSDAAVDKSDAPDGWLGDAAHAGLSFVQHASSALLSGLNQRGVGPAASGSEPVLKQQSTRDPRFLLPMRQNAGHITPATNASGSKGPNNGPEAKQAWQIERAKATQRPILKRQLAVDGEDIDRDAPTSDDE